MTTTTLMSMQSRSCRCMWELICDSFPAGIEITYKYHVGPIADRLMAEYKPKTRMLAWTVCRDYAINTNQMRRISKGSFEWLPPVTD